MAEQGYDLMHKDDVVASLQLDDLSGTIKMALTSLQILFLPYTLRIPNLGIT